MYVINSVTSGIGCLVQATTEPFMKWTQNDDMPSQGNPMGSLVVVILVAIQLFMTVAVARSVIYFLLLTSGDVEQNPGPPTQTEGNFIMLVIVGGGGGGRLFGNTVF